MEEKAERKMDGKLASLQKAADTALIENAGGIKALNNGFRRNEG